MSKRLSALLILAICLTLLCGCVNAGDTPTEPPSEVAESTITPLLYKVTDNNGNVIWLFGSIHVGMDSYYPLPRYVTDAFTGSDALAVEVDIVRMELDLIGQFKYLGMLAYPDGSSLSEHIPEETYNRAVAILEENGMYNALLDKYMPAFWWSSIESLTYEKLDAKANLGIDRHLLKQARQQEKEIREVESAEFQYQLMGSFSPELQLLLLESAITGYDNLTETEAAVEEMMNLWASGDEAAFSAYLSEEEDVPSEEAELYEEYNNSLITQRNLSMTEYAVEALESGDEVFICVGAAHIVGPGAMAENLRQLGYTVELVN